MTKKTHEEVVAALEEIEQALTGHGIGLHILEDRVELVTNKEVAASLVESINAEEEQLSKTALETLTIIAYLGPITRADVDVIRGVDSRRMLHLLLRRDLVERRGKKGASHMYAPTTLTLRQLGVKSVKELPNYDEVKSDPKLLNVFGDDN